MQCSWESYDRKQEPFSKMKSEASCESSRRLLNRNSRQTFNRASSKIVSHALNRTMAYMSGGALFATSFGTSFRTSGDGFGYQCAFVRCIKSAASGMIILRFAHILSKAVVRVYPSQLRTVTWEEVTTTGVLGSKSVE